MDPQLIAFFVGFAANVASDLTRDGIGWLSRRLGGRHGDPTSPTARRLNTSLQAELAKAGVHDATAVKVADFVLRRANISYLLLLAYSANQVQVEVQRETYRRQFREELKAHLLLEADLDPQVELGPIVEILGALLERGAAAMVAAAPRASLEESATRPPALVLFRNASDRFGLFDALGRPDLAAYLQYTKLYNAAAAARFGEIQLQHLGSSTPAITLESIYVQPTFSPFRGQEGPVREEPVMGMKQALSAAPRKVFLGPAGIGKSTFVRFTAFRIAQMGDEGGIAPFVIELRKLSARPESGLFVEHLRDQVTSLVQAAPPDGWLEYLLLTGRAVVFFDGFDEVLDAGDRSRVRDAIRGFTNMYVAADVIVTSRIKGYDAAPFPSNEFSSLRVRDFDPARVEQYAGKWFAQRSADVSENTVASFLDESERYADELRRNPLMLSLICSVYFYRGDIPRSLKELYERCASLMFQEWATIRGIREDGAWSVNLRPALYRLALVILNNPKYRGSGMPRPEIERQLKLHWQSESIMGADEAAEEARRVVDLWTGRAWIITAVSSDSRNRPLYGFVHQSFLEFFSATAISRSSDSPTVLFSQLRARILLLNGWSVAQMAVSIFDASHDMGGARLVQELIDSLPALPRSSRLNLLRFAIDLLEIVRMPKTVEQSVVRAAFDLFAESVLLPIPGMNFVGLQQEGRHIHGRVGESEFDEMEDDEYDPDLLATFEPPALGSIEDFPISTLETEPLLSALAEACRESEARTELVVSVLNRWSPVHGPERSMVTAVFFAHLLVSAVPSSDADVRQVLEDLATRWAEAGLNWLFFAACLTAGVGRAEEFETHMPWNTQVTKDQIVLSYLTDVDVPTVMNERVFTLLSDEPRMAKLEAIGRSFHQMHRDGLPWDPILCDDPGVVPLPPKHSAQVVETRGWSRDAFFGMFVILALYLEMFDRDITLDVLGESRVDVVGAMLDVLLGEGSPDELRKLGVPDELIDVVEEWSSGRVRLTTRHFSGVRADD